MSKRQEVKTLDESVSAQRNAVQFERLYEQYANDVLRMAYFYLADRHKAEDVCQDVFVKLYTHGHTIEPGKEKAWLLRVTVNSCRDLWRGAWLKRVVLGAPTLELIPAQDETIEKREEKETLMRAVNKLPGAFRETVLLHYYQGMGISEIAQMLDLPEGTISSRLSRARKKLEVLLKEEETSV
jgi:RNA polymerase sigma-70 factor (ECF subfamily)